MEMVIGMKVGLLQRWRWRWWVEELILEEGKREREGEECDCWMGDGDGGLFFAGTFLAGCRVT
jgi:hypothetical protein